MKSVRRLSIAVVVLCLVSLPFIRMCPEYKAMAAVQQQHLNVLEDNGWEIYYYPFKSSDVLGETDYKTRTISLYGCNASTVYHELGHALFYIAGLNNCLEPLYNIEADGLLREYGRLSTSEFAACAFAEYYTDNEHLRTELPYTYNLIETVFFQDEHPINVEYATYARQVLLKGGVPGGGDRL